METKQRVKVSERIVLLITPDEMDKFSKLAKEKRLPKAVLMRDALSAAYPDVFEKQVGE